MQSSRSFELKIKQAHKYKREHPEFDVEASIIDSFGAIFNGPKAMAAEIYEHFTAHPDKLMVIIDMYNNELEKEEAAVFIDEDWAMLIEVTNRFANEMELDDLQGIMQFFLDVGGLDTE